MKKTTYLIIVIIIIILTACSENQYTNSYRKNDFLVQYKINKESSVGSVSIIYKNRIYYFSTEQKTSGIYSMDLNGDNVRFELEAKDIQKLQIKDDTLYYLIMDKVFYGSKGSQWGNRYYVLEAVDLKTNKKTSYNSITESIIEKKYSSDYRGIWDFYYLGRDKFIVSDIELDGPKSLFTLKSNMMNINGSTYNFGTYNKLELKTVKGEYFSSLDFYSVGSDILMLLVHRGEWKLNDGLYTDRFSVYDENLNSSFTVTDTVILSQAEPRIFYKKGDNYIISSQNYVLESTLR